MWKQLHIGEIASRLAKSMSIRAWMRLLSVAATVTLLVLLALVGVDIYLVLLIGVTVVCVISYSTQSARENAVRHPFLTLLMGFALVGVVGLLLCCYLPSSFVQTSDSPRWTYRAPAKHMTRFLVTREPHLAEIAKHARTALPFAPILPASLFLTIAISYHRRFPATRFGATVIGSFKNTAHALSRRGTLARITTRRASSLRGWMTTHLHGQKVASLIAFTLPCFIGIVCVIIINEPKHAAFVSTLLSTVVALGVYLLSCFIAPAEPEDDERQRPPHYTNHADHHFLVTLASLTSILLYGSAVWLVADSRSLISRMNQEYPSPHGPIDMLRVDNATAKAIDHIAMLINKAEPSRPNDVKEIRDKTRDVITSIETSKSMSYSSVNLCRAAWFIFWIVIALSIWIFTDRDRVKSLLFVTTAYVAVGLSFGMIYYDYYLSDIAAFNFLINTFGNNRQIKALQTRNKALARTEQAAFTLNEPLIEAQERINDSSFNMLIRTKFFSTSVFAQDEPQLAVDATVPQRPRIVFEGSFQFERNAYVARPETYLAHRPDPSRLSEMASAAEMALAADSEPEKLAEARFDAQRCVSLALSTLSVAISKGSAWTIGGEGTNRATMQQLMTAICREASRHRGAGSRGYEVEVVGGADCEGTEVSNVNLSERRRQNIMERIRQILDDLITRYPDNEPLADFRMALGSNTVVPYVQPKDSSICDSAARGWKSLWPIGLSESYGKEKKLNQWRAAAVTVKALELDRSQSLRMAGGLSEDTTLADMMYFSFVSFTTTGYGDIKPVSGAVRFCVILENILEIMFAAFFFVSAKQ